MDNRMTGNRNQAGSARKTCMKKQQGAAILIVTILTLVIGTIAAFAIGRVSMQEQTIVGTDVRNKEVYSAAIGGLEFAMGWVQDRTNLEGMTWTDNDSDTFICEGDSASTTALANTAMTADTYVHGINFILNNCIDERPLMITVSSTATGLNDTHITKTVSQDLMIGEESIITVSFTGGDPFEFSAPPMLLEGCTVDITGNPDIYVNPDGMAIGTTQGAADDICLDNGHLDLNGVVAPSTGKFSFDPQMPLSQAVFGVADVTDDPTDLATLTDGEAAVEAMLLELEEEEPTRVMVVNATYPRHAGQPAFGGQIQTDLGVGPDNTPNTSDDEPVILYIPSLTNCLARQAYDASINCNFDPCKKINGGVNIVGIVYYAEELDCSSNGFGGGDIYGTLAKKGDVTKLNSNTELWGSDLGFSGASDATETEVDIATTAFAKFSQLPGTWLDF